ncbi:MAG: type II CAAX endopeptidase family protein [Chloroflexota bacterium]
MTQHLPPDDRDGDAFGDDEDPPAALTPDAPQGPPGGRTFSLEGRPVPSLYLLAWLLTVGGLGALLFVAQAGPSAGGSFVALVATVSMGLGLAAAAGYQLVARADRHPDRYRGPSPLILFGLVLVVSTLLSAGLAVLGLLDVDHPVGFLASLVAVAATYLVVIWVFVVRGGALRWVDMGWPSRATSARVLLRDVGEAMLVMLPVTIGVLLWGGILATLLRVTAPDTLPEATNATEALALVLAAAVVAPIGEEAFFRGFALTAWWRDLGPRAALIRSALFFAVVHILNIQVGPEEAGQGLAQALLSFLVILPLGLALGWLFQRRGIVASIAGHVTYNGILLVLVALAPTGGATPGG